MKKTYAILSDIHGNSFALKIVLDYLKQRKVDAIINLGDTLYGPIDPKGTYDLIKNLDIHHIAGNQDKVILDPTLSNPNLDRVKKEIPKEAYHWFDEMPTNITVDDELFCFHGSPEDYHKYFIEGVDENGTYIKPNDEIEKELSKINHRFILCGHSHTPHVIELKDKVVINPGSVGIQAYDDDEPHFHKMENFSPHARFCFLHIDDDKNYQLEQIVLPYDWEKASIMAKQNQREDWAEWLLSGRA